ncbi:MAG: hypothetical protein ABFD82_03810 [Syntrophaceae bacterium]
MKGFVAVQDCSKCPKRDDRGDCCKPGPCIWVDAYADGDTPLRESPIDPIIAERKGEKGYLNLVEKMDIARYKKLFKANPIMSKIITMLVAGATYSDIEMSLHVHRRTISKAKKLWLEMKEDKEEGEQ